MSPASIENLANRLEKIFVEKRKGEIIEILQLVDPSIKDIMIGRKNMIYVDVGFDKYIPINIEGDGPNRLLNIITNLYHNKDGILFIDEIENGFHYKLLGTAWKAIMKAATRFNVQLFITTHNVEVLQQLNLSLEEPIFQSYRNEVSAYSLIKKSDHQVEAIRHSFQQFHHAIENGIELR